MPETRRKYDPEFREGAVRIVRETGKPIAQVAQGSRDQPGHAGQLGGTGTGSSAARRRASPSMSGLGCSSSSGRTPSCGWSVMSSSDPWSCGSRRRRDERGVVHRLPRGPTMVFPTRSAAGGWACRESWFYKWHDREPTARQRRRAELDAAVTRVVRRLGWDAVHLRVAAGAGRPRRGGLAGVDEDGGGVDGPPGPCGPVPETEAPFVDSSRQGSGTDPGSGATRFHRGGDQPTVVW